MEPLCMSIKGTISTGYKDRRHFIDLVVQKAKAGLRAEASRGYLGVLWWILEPVMYMTIFYFVFLHLFQRGDENFVIFLLTGLIVWKWFISTVSSSASSLMANVGLMNQVYVPKILFPLTTVAVNTFKFFVVFALYLVFLQFTETKVTWAWTFLPVVIVTQLFLIVAVSGFLAAIMPFFPDLRVILDNFLLMLFFLSGIFFDISRLPESIQGYLWLNPMAVMINMYRQVLHNSVLPDLQQIVMVLLFSAVTMFFAALIYKHFDRIYPKIIH